MNISDPAVLANMPLAPPPTGHISDFDSPAPNALSAWVLDIGSLTLASLIVLIRFYVKRFVSKAKISWDDGFCVAAVCFGIVHTGALLKTLDYGLGKYMYNIRMISVTDKRLLVMTSLNLILTLNTLMVRYAVLGLYYRLFSVYQRSRQLIYAGFAVSTLVAIPEAGVAIGRMVKCTTPVAGFTITYCSKRNTSIAIMTFASSACIVDVFIYSIAIGRMKLLQVETKRKLQITAVFAMGFLAVVFSLVNLIFNIVKSNTSEQMWYALWVSIFKVLEANIALACTSATFIPGFWKSLFSKPKNTSIKFSDGNARSGYKRTPDSDEALVGSNKSGINLPRLAPAKFSQSDKSDSTWTTKTSRSQDSQGYTV